MGYVWRAATASSLPLPHLGDVGFGVVDAFVGGVLTLSWMLPFTAVQLLDLPLQLLQISERKMLPTPLQNLTRQILIEDPQAGEGIGNVQDLHRSPSVPEQKRVLCSFFTPETLFPVVGESPERPGTTHPNIHHNTAGDMV